MTRAVTPTPIPISSHGTTRQHLGPVQVSPQAYALGEHADEIQQQHERHNRLDRQDQGQQRHGHQCRSKAANAQNDVAGQDDERGKDQGFEGIGHRSQV